MTAVTAMVWMISNPPNNGRQRLKPNVRPIAGQSAAAANIDNVGNRSGSRLNGAPKTANGKYEP